MDNPITRAAFANCVESLVRRVAKLDHDRAMQKLQQEFSDWPAGDLRDAVSSVSHRLSPDVRKVQDRYWELRGGRGKQAAHEQTPNAIDGAAARFKDHLDIKVNEHYRSAHPGEIPPTLNLIHGKEFIRVVKADGGLTREAVAFIARATGNVYLAASWERPQPYVIANVADTASWRGMRLAFNKYNAPEVMGQLLALLRQYDLEEPLELLIKHQIPKAVDTAWKTRGKTAMDRLVRRYMETR